MMCLSILPTTLLGIVIAATQPYVIAANKQADVYRLAKQSTILIDGQNPGSGVIIGKQGNIYFVLTAEHVIETEDEYEIVTPDGARYRLDYNTVKKLPNVDLAIVSFTSDKSYSQAKMGNSDNVTEGDKVFIAGWPAPGKALPHVYQITSGEISGICPRPVARGYRLIYTNVTRAGMSGGPIFNESGEVIGIHGLAEGREVYQSGYEEYPIKTGFNLGIPINTFSRAAKRIDTNIAQLPNSPNSVSVRPKVTTQPAQISPSTASQTPPAPLQTTAKPAQLPTTPQAPPAPLQNTAKPAQLPTTPQAPPAPLQNTAKPAQLPTTPQAPPAPLQTTAKPAQLPTTPQAPPAPLQTTAKPAQLPTTPQAPPAPLQTTAKPAQLPTTSISPKIQPNPTTKLAELLDAPQIPPKTRGPQLSFAQAPRLVSSQSTSKNAKELGATYYFTIDVPASAKLPLQQINLTLKQGVEYPRFKAKAVNAFEGTPRNKGTKLPLGLIVTDPPTRTLTVVFNSPVVPGKGVTIAVRPVRNPSVGTYQFEATAFPEGETAKGQFAGIGRFDFYRSSK
ncbi:DUF2808 domain-containing protein [Acaryochloris marina]|uniref:Protease, putative n=1 Tax=Acaryochloris marina (strain MBIC 11017) TaxID=329726 RepID=B0C9R3_ACAM1|nr:DUF2808 domain-containing protein [Acaryochloris marina]ABW30211.1 protease, putative [Acaryochloris marina MBIC11017]